MRLHVASLGLALALVSVGGAARADVTKAQCVDANGKAQDLRRGGSFAAARAALLQCADPGCPALVRDDCTSRLDELDKAQPSIVFDVKDAAGSDVFEVKVTVDGQPLVDRLGGTPVKVDPGTHSFSFEAAGRPPAALKLLIREGEASRHERVMLAAPPTAATPNGPPTPPAPPSTGAAATAAPPESPPGGGLGTQRILGLAAAGLGVAGIAVGSIFGVMTGNAWSSAKSACGGNPGACTNASTASADRTTAENDATLSNVGFIAGGVLLAAGGVLFFTGGGSSGASTGLTVAPAVGASGVGLTAAGTF